MIGYMKNSAKLLLIAISILAICGCIGTSCENEVIDEKVSPNGKWKAISFERSCGATTGFTAQVSIIEPGRKLPNAPGNVLITDGRAGPNFKMSWLDDNQLVVEMLNKDEIFKFNEKYDDINIVIKRISAR